MLIRTGEITEKAQQEILGSRYDSGYIDALQTCLDRAEGIAGLIADAASLSMRQGVNDGINPSHILQAASAIEKEINDASIILEDFYRQSSLESKQKQQNTREEQHDG